MPQMLDLIRNSQVPSHLMQSAARGSLSVAPDEMIEILVYLAVHHKVFGDQARLTLAGWDEKACLAAVSNPATSSEVLGYFAALENLRPHLAGVLAENHSVTDESLAALATQGERAVLEALLASPRVTKSSTLLMALQANPRLRPNEQSEIENKLASLKQAADAGALDEAHPADPVVEETLAGFLKENAAEVEASKDKLFHPIGEIHEDAGGDTIVAVAPAPAARSVGGAEGRVAPGTAAAAAAAHARKQAPPGHVERRESTLQKIAKLDTKGRISLAVRGSKEDRSILIRDGTKVVALAVLESPKITDAEVEGFAQQKNLLEAVLRHIPLKRRFAKSYSIMRNLVCNPRTPLDTALPLVKGLLVHDLKNLSGNKDVSETVRKMALRLFKQKMDKKQ